MQILTKHATSFICCKTTTQRPFVWDYLGAPIPEETLTHPPSWSSSNLYQLLPSTMIHSILPVQITCLAIFLHNLSPCPLWWSTSWFGVWSPPPHIPYIFHPFHLISAVSTQYYSYNETCSTVTSNSWWITPILLASIFSLNKTR